MGAHFELLESKGRGRYSCGTRKASNHANT